MNSDHPSLWRIAQTDYFASIVTTIPLVAWGMYLLLPGPAGQARDLWLAYAAFGLTLICGLILLWRWRFIASVFQNGKQIEGTITQADFRRERGRVTYTYVFQGQKYKSVNTVLKNKRTSLIYNGQKVMVIVSSNNPKRAFLQEIYL
jgi:hypothetical protein